MFETMLLPVEPSVVAPDGSNVRILLTRSGGSMSHFELPPGSTSKAVEHRTVEEVWYVVGGRGEMWRRFEDVEEVTPLAVGVCLTIPLGTAFQFRALGDEPLTAVAITMPPWPGEDEAIFVDGKW